MIDLTLWTALGVMAWGIMMAWFHWKQWGIITPFSGFLLASVIFVSPGFIHFYFFYDKAGFAQNALLNASLGLGMATAGGYIAEHWFAQRRYSAWRRPLKAVRLRYRPRAYLMTAFILMIFVALYFVLLGYIPLLEGFRALLTEGFKPGLVNTHRVMRDIYVNPDAQYIPLQGLLEAFRYIGMIIVCLWFLHWYRLGYRRRIATWMMLAAIFWLVATGQRWPLLHLLLACLIYFSITLSTRQFWQVVLTVSLIGALVGTVLTALLGRTTEQLTSLLEILYFGGGNLMERILYGNAVAPLLSFDLYPRRYPLLYGGSYLQNLLSYLPGPSPSFPVTFNWIVMGDARGFTAPPDFYTEAYINFGYMGTALLSFLFGVALAGVTRLALPLLRTLTGVSLYATMTLYLSMTGSTGVTFCLGRVVVAGAVVGLLQVAVFIERFLGRGSWRREEMQADTEKSRLGRPHEKGAIQA